MAIPSKAQILVVGGGPAGSYSAGLLAREGFEVVLLEADSHPRYHIGESLLPSMIPHLKFFGIEDKVRKHGFVDKPGAACKFVKDQVEGYTNFVEVSKLNGAWNVERADFDNICFRHAGELGARIFENKKVVSIEFADGAERRPIAATWKSKNGETGEIAFEYLVDASGRNGIMSTRYLKNRVMKDSLKNIAQWSYWSGAKRYMPGTERENAPYFESLSDGSGWAWFIPLREKVSVGVVLHEKVNIVRRKAAESLEEHYLNLLESVPNIKGLLGDAQREEEKVRQASDFSYAATDSAGDHFRIIGDASCFIDPLFSSGVHLAFVGGLSAAATIAASIRGDVDEHTAARYHDKKIGTAYTRFLIVVLSVYRQIRRQDIHVLSDVDSDNFQAAFDLIRPIIQGTSDTRGQVSSGTARPLDEEELRSTIAFCTDMLSGRSFKADKSAPTTKYAHSAAYAPGNAKYCPSPESKTVSSAKYAQSAAYVAGSAKYCASSEKESVPSAKYAQSATYPPGSAKYAPSSENESVPSTKYVQSAAYVAGSAKYSPSLEKESVPSVKYAQSATYAPGSAKYAPSSEDEPVPSTKYVQSATYVAGSAKYAPSSENEPVPSTKYVQSATYLAGSAKYAPSSENEVPSAKYTQSATYAPVSAKYAPSSENEPVPSARYAQSATYAPVSAKYAPSENESVPSAKYTQSATYAPVSAKYAPSSENEPVPSAKYTQSATYAPVSAKYAPSSENEVPSAKYAQSVTYAPGSARYCPSAESASVPSAKYVQSATYAPVGAEHAASPSETESASSVKYAQSATYVPGSARYCPSSGSESVPSAKYVQSATYVATGAEDDSSPSETESDPSVKYVQSAKYAPGSARYCPSSDSESVSSPATSVCDESPAETTKCDDAPTELEVAKTQSTQERSSGYYAPATEAVAQLGLDGVQESAEDSIKYNSTAYPTQAGSAAYVMPRGTSIRSEGTKALPQGKTSTKYQSDETNGAAYPSNMYKAVALPADPEMAAAQKAAKESVGKSMTDAQSEILNSLQVTMEQFVKDEILGCAVRLERGNLGLRRV